MRAMESMMPTSLLGTVLLVYDMAGRKHIVSCWFITYQPVLYGVVYKDVLL